MIEINLCPSPDLYPFYHKDEEVCIIVDILRASTTMVTALHNGAASILPVASTEECKAIGEQKGYLMAAERNVNKCDFAQLGNAPDEYVESIVSGKNIVLTTTNGTRSIRIAQELSCSEIWIGAFINIEYTANYIIHHNYQSILVVGAGWQGQVSLEDMLYAGALAEILKKHGKKVKLNDAAITMALLWQTYGSCVASRLSLIEKSEHYNRLCLFHIENCIPYCLETNSVEALAKLDKDGHIRLCQI